MMAISSSMTRQNFPLPCRSTTNFCLPQNGSIVANDDILNDSPKNANPTLLAPLIEFPVSNNLIGASDDFASTKINDLRMIGESNINYYESLRDQSFSNSSVSLLAQNPMPITLRELTETSVADDHDGSAALNFSSQSSASSVSGLSPHPFMGRADSLTQFVPFSNEAVGENYVTHWIAIRGVDPSDVHSGLVANILRKKSPMFLRAVEAIVANVLHFEIDGLKTAQYAKTAVSLVNPSWWGEFVAKPAIVGYQSKLMPIQVLEGQMRVTVRVGKAGSANTDLLQPNGSDLLFQRLCKYLHQSWGEVRTGRITRFDLEERILIFRIELDSLLAYKTLIAECRGKTIQIEGMDVSLEEWPAHEDTASSPSETLNKYSYDALSSERRAASNAWLNHSSSNEHLSRVGKTSPVYPLPSLSATGRLPITFHLTNSVSKEKILSGQDVRTTIMLRNIPNRIDVKQFKDFLDATSFGRYDFSYLRIDFQTNSNVGYAFINFVDANSIIPFADAVAGRQWAEWGSQKTAQISYATIQGRDCLIQKFRNSSVMREHPDHRPKLWYSFASNVPSQFIGTEEAFPGPDNHSKLQRSIDNATHQGLYPPRAGESYAEERSRRGYWDRGTIHELAERLLYFAEMRCSPTSRRR